MEWKIPLSDIDFDIEETNAITGVIQSKWLTMGPLTQKFEEKFAQYLGVKHAFGVSNCTAALHLANRILGLGSNDEVILPSLTFVATANSTLYTGAKPVFADIESLDNFNISPKDILQKITSKTKAVTVMHYGGYPCNMDEILEIAEEHDLTVIEDAAHAPGAEYKRKKCGTIGDIGCFSFFSNKNLVTGEGGMIVTNNDDYAEKIKIIRSHGMNTLTWDRYKDHTYGYDVVDLGYNYRINEIASALGLVQLEKLNANNNRRKLIVEEYRKQLEDITEITVPFTDFKEKSSFHIFPILLSKNINRDNFIENLKSKRIQSSIHYPPIHLFTYYRNLFGFKEGLLPNTELVGKCEVTLPLHPLMTTKDIKIIVDTIKETIDNYRE